MTINNTYYSTPKVAIIILNWNGKEDTIECLKSFEKIDYQNYELVVVDNGSEDDSVAAIKQMFPEIIVIETGHNLGYAGGNNAGIRYALKNDTEYVLLLNNDTVVDEKLIEAFIKANTKLIKPAILGGKIYYHAQPDTLWYAGANWVPSKLDFEHIGMGQKDGSAFDQLSKTEYVTGCLMFVPAEIFHQVGLLDEGFFLIYEETDWCYRARKYGYECYYIPTAKIWHKVSASFGGSSSPISEYFIARNRLLWARKHLGLLLKIKLYLQYSHMLWTRIFPRFVLANTPVSFLKRYFWSFASWLKALKRNFYLPSNQAFMRGVMDYFFRRLGNCPKSIRTLPQSNLTND